MDKEIIFLIIIFLFSLVSNLLNKKKKQQQKKKTTQNEGGDTPQPRKKPFSFEDILKEFEAETLGKPQEREVQPDPGDYRKEAEVKERALDEKERYMDKAPTIEGTESKYASFEGSSYETIDDDEIQKPEKLGVSKRDAHYDLEKEESNRFAEILHDEEGLKKAIILNEILKRKYC